MVRQKNIVHKEKNWPTQAWICFLPHGNMRYRAHKFNARRTDRVRLSSYFTFKITLQTLMKYDAGEVTVKDVELI
jgi:hypothetical protein